MFPQSLQDKVQIVQHTLICPVMYSFRSIQGVRKGNPGRKITMSKKPETGNSANKAVACEWYDFSRGLFKGEERERTREVLFIHDAFSV